MKPLDASFNAVVLMVLAVASTCFNVLVMWASVGHMGPNENTLGLNGPEKKFQGGTKQKF